MTGTGSPYTSRSRSPADSRSATLAYPETEIHQTPHSSQELYTVSNALSHLYSTSHSSGRRPKIKKNDRKKKTNKQNQNQKIVGITKNKNVENKTKYINHIIII